MLEERVIEWTRDWKELGIQEGRRIGRQEGRQEGRTKSARQSVLDVLEIRFGLAAQAVQRAMEREDDPARLRMLHRQAMLVPSLEAFELLLAQSSGNGDSALN